MKRILLITVLAALLLSACSVFGGMQLSNARNRWQSSSLTHYRYDLHVGCFCAFVEKMPLTIEVQDGRVVSMQYQDGTAVSAEDRQIFERYETIDKLFDFTAESQKKADEIKISYDPAYGFPDNVYIDFIRQAADDELSLQVTKFEKLP